MAYPTISKPYGLKPINLIGGQVFAGATRQIAITTGSVNYNTALYNGQVVQLDTSGTVIASALATDTSAVAGVLGVFLGCRYTNPVTKQPTYSQYWPGFASGVTDALLTSVMIPMRCTRLRLLVTLQTQLVWLSPPCNRLPLVQTLVSC